MGPKADAAARLNLFNQYRGLLFSIAYRMLGSVADAEDILQEAFLRWQGATSGEIESPRAFLITIVSRLSINHLQSAREEYIGQWLPEPVITSGDADPTATLEVDESLSMAFLVMLERLTPMERAVFLLREVFEYEYADLARTLGQSEANCRQILRRAKQHVAELRPRFRAPAGQRDELLRKFQLATQQGDLSEIVALLSHDAVLRADGGGKAPAVPNLIHGAENIARAVIGGTRKFAPPGLTTCLARVNGELGIVTYSNGRPFLVVTIEAAEGVIQAVYVVSNPEKLAHLPALQ